MIDLIGLAPLFAVIAAIITPILGSILNREHDEESLIKVSRGILSIILNQKSEGINYFRKCVNKPSKVKVPTNVNIIFLEWPLVVFLAFIVIIYFSSLEYWQIYPSPYLYGLLLFLMLFPSLLYGIINTKNKKSRINEAIAYLNNIKESGIIFDKNLLDDSVLIAKKEKIDIPLKELEDFKSNVYAVIFTNILAYFLLTYLFLTSTTFSIIYIIIATAAIFLISLYAFWQVTRNRKVLNLIYFRLLSTFLRKFIKDTEYRIPIGVRLLDGSIHPIYGNLVSVGNEYLVISYKNHEEFIKLTKIGTIIT